MKYSHVGLTKEQLDKIGKEFDYELTKVTEQQIKGYFNEVFKKSPKEELQVPPKAEI